MDILTNYSFIVVALGTFLLATAAGAIGCINVLKGQSLIGDAIGHSTFPGVILAFMLTLSREPAYLLLGALGMGIIAFSLIQFIKTYSRQSLDAILAIVLSTFFGLGMVLKSYIQGNSAYRGAAQSGLKNYIFGQAAYITHDDVILIAIAAILALITLVVFYKEIKLFLFDPEYAKTIGISNLSLNSIILFCTILLIATGLKVVGAILISSMLIIPAITALQWSHSFKKVLMISAISGGISAVIGTFISTKYAGLSTGPTIIVIMAIVAAYSLVFGPHGIIANAKMMRREQ